MKIEKLNKDNIKEFIRDIDTAEEIELNINKLEYYAVKDDDIYLLAFEMLSDEDKISIKYVNNKVKEDKFLDIINYLNYKNQKTTIYNKKKAKTKKLSEYIGDSSIIYQNPQDIQITESSNNLIYIYLESIENSFIDTENGGIKDVNCLPELTQLAKENISFSNTDKLGGAFPFTGTTWTIASMTAQLTGLPLKVRK